MKNRTSSYKFTVEMKNGKPSGEGATLVEALRSLVKLSNSTLGTNKYVKLQGRGPRPSRRYHQSLPLGMAVTADVYVYDRYI